MNKLELLRQAKAKVDALVAEKKAQEVDSSAERDSAFLAVMMNSVDAIISTIESIRVNEETIAEAVRNEIAKIQIPPSEVNIPEIKLPSINVPEAKVTVSIPEIKIPPITVPEPRVTVNVPEIKAPNVSVNMPDSMETHGDVGLFGYGFDNPLPVQLRDANGNPVSLPEMMSVASGGGGPRYVKINNTVSEPIPISGNITSTPGATYYASDAVGSVNIVQSITLPVSVSGATGTIGVVTINPDGNPVYSGGASGGGLTDTELRASSVDVQQASGASWSTNVLSMPAVTVTSITNTTAVMPVDSTGIAYSGSNPFSVVLRDPTGAELDLHKNADNFASGADYGVMVMGVLNTTTGNDKYSYLHMHDALADSETNSVTSLSVQDYGMVYDSANALWNRIRGGQGYDGPGVMRVVHATDVAVSTSVLSMPSVTVTSITNSTASALVDSAGTQYSGSNPVPTKEVRSATPSQTSPSVGVTSTSILASNANRLGATIYNEGTATCYMKLGSTASLTSYSCQIASGGYYEVPFGYTGAIDGITSASTAQLRVTEIT